MALAALPAELPLGMGHGDFAAHNCFAGAHGRVTVFDTEGEWQAPIYEDLAHFLVAVGSVVPHVQGRRLMFDNTTIQSLQSAFVGGYFGSAPVPVVAVRLFEIQALLDRWSSMKYSLQKAIAWRKQIKQCRTAGRTTFFRRYLEELVRDLPDPGWSSTAQRPMARVPLRSTHARTSPRASTLSDIPVKVAYLTSRFPKLTETFVFREMLAVERLGVEVEFFPLRRERATTMHTEAVSLVKRAHFTRWLSWAIIRAHLHFLRRKPRTYCEVLSTLLRANWGSLRYSVGALAFFPKAVYLAHTMSAQGIAHIHAHFASHPAAVAFVIHRLVGIPYSFTAHGSDLHRECRMLREKVDEAVMVVAISNFNRDRIIAECGPESGRKVVVIHCGVDTQVFRPPHAEPDAGVSGRVSILCIGTLHEVKGQAYLVEACRLLNQRGIGADLHFVGDGPDRRRLVKQVGRAGLGNSVRFHGQKRGHDVAALLRGAQVVVAPSVPTSDGRREGIPVVLMEAMSSGVAVVASHLSGIPELVENGECGLLVECRDVRALADALQQLLQDPALRRRLGQAGRAKVVREFDVRTNAALLADRFRACAAAGFGAQRPAPLGSTFVRVTP